MENIASYVHSTYELKVIGVVTFAILFYFMTDNYNEIRREMANGVKIPIIYEIDREIQNGFGSGGQKFKAASQKVINAIGAVGGIKSLDQRIGVRKDNMINSKSRTFMETHPKLKKIYETFTSYNDIVLYLVLLGLMLTIIFYGKSWWEEYFLRSDAIINSGLSQEEIDEEVYMFNKLKWLLPSIICFSLFIVFVIHGRNVYDFLFYNVFQKDNKRFSINKNCDIRINDIPTKGDKKIATGVGLLAVLALLSILITGCLFSYITNMEEQDNYDDDYDKQKYKMTIAGISMVVFSLLIISFFWMIFGCRTFWLKKSISCIGSREVGTEDKFVFLSMVILTLVGFMSWGVYKI